MQCDRHPYRMAVAECMGCHKGLCDECRKLYRGQSICNECLIDIRKRDVPYNVDDEVSTVSAEFSKLRDDIGSLIKKQVESIGSNDHGYLVCENCLGYYKLEEGESPDDFESCRCGGNLRFIKKLDDK